MNKPNYTVSLYNERLEASLRKFVEYFWATDSSENSRIEQSEQSNVTKEKSEKTRPPTFLFLKDDEVLGHLATIPVRLLIHSRIISAHWVVGFMVMPEYRNGPIGPLLIKKVNETLDFAMTLHVENNVLKIFKGLGWKHPGVIPQFIQVIDAYRLLKNINIERLKGRNDGIGKWLVIGLSNPFTRFLISFFASTALKIWNLGTAVLRPRCGPYKVTEEYSFNASYDALWEEVGRKFDATVVRDGKYLESRFGRRLEKYRLLACRKNKRLIGYCILKVKTFNNDPRMGNARVGTLIDCLFHPEDFSGLQLLFFEAKKTFRNEKVDAIFCTASYGPLRNFLMKNGFIKVPGNLNFAFYGSNSLEPLEDFRLSEWHIMRGDADADHNF